MIPEYSGYVFPNDVHILWSLMIVMYPYVTGLVAGAFIVSSLYHVFGKDEFRPISRLALAASLCFLVVATWPLLNHLGHPERALNIMITPNFSSAMAGFGILYNSYLALLLIEIWFIFRKDIIMTARRSRGIKRFFYAALALGTYNISERALQKDARIIVVLAALGIPAACGLHGYVGFLFGALKSNPWWSTPLMPIIFLNSAIVSGIAALILVYQIAAKVKRIEISSECILSLARYLWFFLIISLTLELLEVVTLWYEKAEEWEIISELLSSKIPISFIGIQLIIGGLLPFILLMIITLMSDYMKARLLNVLAGVASFLVLVQVLAMRWNVVIGGQIFSKSLRGFRENYSPSFFEKEGILAAIVIFIMPFLFLILFDKVLPLFAKPGPAEAGEETEASAAKS